MKILSTLKNNNQLNYLFYLLGALFLSLPTYAQHTKNYQTLRMDSVLLHEAYIYLDKPTISGATYNFDQESILSPSKYDRMLFIVDGNCRATAKSQTFDLKTGDVLFLKAYDAIEFSLNVKMMVWTSKSTKTNHTYKTKQFTKKQIEKRRNSSKNVWSSFIETSTMVAGLYMLPKSINGDSTLIHEFDEVNYVLKGTAKFKMNDSIVDVRPGSIMWVKRGVTHHFYDLSDDFDVFILFETINMDH